MPNTLGYTNTGGGQFTARLMDPRPERYNRSRLARFHIPQLELVNSVYVGSGRWPTRGWLLMLRREYDLLDRYSTSLVLNLEDTRNDTNLTLYNLAIAQARCVSRGLPSDPAAVYLVEVTDRRGVIWNEWFARPTNTQYNVRAPAYPQQYYQDSGGGFTWTGMVSDLWGQMPLLGTYPGLPVAPADDPEGFIFPGVSAWEAMHLILDRLGVNLTVDLTSPASQFGLVSGGADDPAFDELTARYALLKEDDLEYIDTGAARVPGEVTVYFHRRNALYGTEETVRRDTLQWSTTPLYEVTVTSPFPFNSAPGRHYLHSEFTVRYDVDGVPFPTDVATAASVADEMTRSYFDRIYSRTSGFMRRTYTGCLPFKTGSQCDGVCWHQSFDPGRERSGWRTEIIRGPEVPWPQVYVDVSRR